jgi:hypothetical protein
VKDVCLPFSPEELTIKEDSHTLWVWDIFRKKWVILTPEEFIRQQFLHYMVNHLGYPLTNIVVEKKITYHKLNKRFDAMVIDKQGRFLMVLEFKKTNVNLNEDVLLQATSYVATLRAKSVFITNGTDQRFIFYAEKTNTWVVKNELPSYEELQQLE